MIIGAGPGVLPATLGRRLEQLRTGLADAGIAGAADLAAQAHRTLGLTRGERQWRRASRLLRPLVTRSARRTTGAEGALALLDRAVGQQRAAC